MYLYESKSHRELGSDQAATPSLKLHADLHCGCRGLRSGLSSTAFCSWSGAGLKAEQPGLKQHFDVGMGTPTGPQCQDLNYTLLYDNISTGKWNTIPLKCEKYSVDFQFFLKLSNLSYTHSFPEYSSVLPLVLFLAIVKWGLCENIRSKLFWGL